MTMDNDLLLVEDLLLLLLDDDTGIPAGAGTLYYTLGGAVLVELALRGSIEIDESSGGLAGPRVLAVEPGAPSDPLLRSAYETIAEKPRGVQTLLAMIGPDLYGEVIDRLVERGILRRESKKVLRVFNRTTLEVDDARHEAELRQKIYRVLVDGETPDPRTAAIVGLVSGSGALPSIHPPLAPWSSTTYERAKELEEGHWGAEAVNMAVTRTSAAITASAAIAIAANAARS